MKHVIDYSLDMRRVYIPATGEVFDIPNMIAYAFADAMGVMYGKVQVDEVGAL